MNRIAVFLRKFLRKKDCTIRSQVEKYLSKTYIIIAESVTGTEV